MWAMAGLTFAVFVLWGTVLAVAIALGANAESAELLTATGAALTLLIAGLRRRRAAPQTTQTTSAEPGASERRERASV